MKWSRWDALRGLGLLLAMLAMAAGLVVFGLAMWGAVFVITGLVLHALASGIELVLPGTGYGERMLLAAVILVSTVAVARRWDR